MPFQYDGLSRGRPWAPWAGRRWPGQLEELSDHSCALAHIARDQLRADDANEAGVRTSEHCISVEILGEGRRGYAATVYPGLLSFAKLRIILDVG